MKKGKEFRILSIDGGGVRGIIPACFLSKIEEKIGKPIHEYFDLICGTSTGGIIALAGSAGIPMKEVLSMYLENSGRIFKRANWWEMIFGKGGLYRNEILKESLEKVFHRNNKHLLVRDAKTCLCIPSIDLIQGKCTIFKTPHSVLKPKAVKYKGDRHLYS